MAVYMVLFGLNFGQNRPFFALQKSNFGFAFENERTVRHKFNEFAEIPLFWLFAEAAVNPKYVAEYTFPGVITGFFTHLEYVKLAP